MKTVAANRIICANPTGGARIYIPGGWRMRVPEITIDADAMRVYAHALGSRDEAASVHQRVYESGFVTALRLAIARRAQEYARRWPELQERIYIESHSSRHPWTHLRGFDPERVQTTFVPFDYPGRAGNDAIDEVLRQLAQEALAE